MATRKYGIVSMEFPLISNLSLHDNVELIGNYHRKEIFDICDMFRKFGVEQANIKREPNISNYERFVTMLLRAAMYSDSLLLATVFSIVPERENIADLQKELDLIKEFISHIKILDFTSNRYRY